MRRVPLYTEAEGRGASLLLGAFIGCFEECAEEWKLETPMMDSPSLSEGGGVQSDNVCNESDYVIRMTRLALRHLLYDGNGTRAKEVLETLIGHVCEHREAAAGFSYPLSSFCSSGVSPAQGCMEPGGDKDAYMLQVLHDLTEVDCALDGFEAPTGCPDVVFPCPLIHVVYYLACAQCGQDGWKDCEGWANVFFTRLIPVDVSKLQGYAHSSGCAREMSALPQAQVNSNHCKQRLEVMDRVRCGIAQLLSTALVPQSSTHILCFLDIYLAWIRRSFRYVADESERLLRAMPCDTCNCTITWIARHTLRFIHMFSVAATRNLSYTEKMQEMEWKYQYVGDSYCNRVEACGGRASHDPKRGRHTQLPAFPSLLQGVEDAFNRIIFADRHEDEGEKCTFGNKVDGRVGEMSREPVSEVGQQIELPRETHDTCLSDCGSMPEPSNGCSSLFVSLLEVWLLAKKYTDAGDMVSSRDLILRRLNGHLGVGVSGSASSCVTITRKVCASLTGQYPHVIVYVCPIQWLRQVLLVNCAALVDASTVLHMLHCWPEPFTPAEAVYLSVCPTLVCGCVHSSILSSFPVNSTETGTTTSIPLETYILSLSHLPFPVQLPLLMRQLLQLQQELKHLPHNRQGDDGEHNSDRRGGSVRREGGKRDIFLKRDILTLCDCLVERARGLFGTLELSFTECSPQRAVFEAIIVACELKEDILHAAAAVVMRSNRSCPSSPSPNNSCERSDRGEATVVSNGSTGVMELASVPGVPSLDEPDAGDYEVATTGTYHDFFDKSESASQRGHSMRSSTSSRKMSGSCPFSNPTSQEVYWLAHRLVPLWMGFLEHDYPQLKLTVGVCRLRMAAATFDMSSPQSARRLVAEFPENALVSVHAAVAFFVSLCIVEAQSHISEALEKYPHSKELQRIHHMICGSAARCKADGPVYVEEGHDKMEGCRETGVTYSHNYRGMTTVEFNVVSDNAGLPWSQVMGSVVCLGVFSTLVTLHWWDTAVSHSSMRPSLPSSSCNNQSSCDHGRAMDLCGIHRWSFEVPFIPLVYVGFCPVAYAALAGFLIPHAAGRQGVLSGQCALIARHLSLLLREESLVDNNVNRLNFCLRGLSLVNVVLGIQLVIVKVLQCQISVNAVDTLQNTNNASETQHISGNDRVFMHWCIGLLLVLALFVVATAFHGSAWRVVRCHDVMTGTLSTFIAVFFVDLTFTIVSFPVIFILSVLLEPLLFTILAAFSITTSLPVLLEHLPTVPADGVSCLLCPLDVGGQRHCRSLDEFCVQVVPFFSRQLLSNPPPVRWSERWSHPKPITCAHEVQQLSVECQHDNSHRPLSLTGGRKDISYTVQQLLSRCIGLVFVLRQVACWKVSRCRETSSAVVRLAHLREGYGALFPPRTAFSPEEVVDQPLADLKVSKLLSRASPVKRSSPGNAFG